MSDTEVILTTRDTVRSRVASLLYCEPDAIGDDVTLQDLGLDSVLAVELISTLNGDFGVDERAAVIYEHPTVDRLSRYLAEQRGAR
jgi:acyl carrier protein